LKAYQFPNNYSISYSNSPSAACRVERSQILALSDFRNIGKSEHNISIAIVFYPMMNISVPISFGTALTNSATCEKERVESKFDMNLFPTLAYSSL
jgi:hypothetical protein